MIVYNIHIIVNGLLDTHIFVLIDEYRAFVGHDDDDFGDEAEGFSITFQETFSRADGTHNF